VLEVVLLRLVHHFDAGAGDVELPAMIDAAQATFLVAPEIERDAPMRAELLKQADTAFAVTKCHQVFAEQADAGGRAVGFGNFLREECRNPVHAHRIAHRCVLTDPGDEFVFLA
jgi:hypothetical protein